MFFFIIDFNIKTCNTNFDAYKINIFVCFLFKKKYIYTILNNLIVIVSI